MKRSEVYDLAWAVPISKLAGRFGLSDRGLAKICERNHIPLPGRGYWAKVAANQYPPRDPLPRPDQDHEIPLRESAAPSPSPGSDDVAQLDKSPNEGLLKILGLLPPSESKPATKKMVRSSSLSSKPPPAPVKPTPTDPFEIYSSLGAECERAMAAGMEYQRRQAAQAFLQVLVSRAPQMDATSAEALLAWVRAMHTLLKQNDPAEAVMQSIRQATQGQHKPLWWQPV